MLQQLDTRRKAAMKSTKGRLPTTIRIPVGHTPCGTEVTAVAAAVPRRRKQWSDYLRPQNPDKAGVTQEIQKLNKVPNPVHTAQQPLNPLDAMEKLLEDLRVHGPLFEGAAPGKAFDVVGGFKTADCAHASNLIVGTLNVGGLEDFKLLMMQNKIDVLVLTDTQHSSTSADYYRKMVQARLGGAARVFASATTPRKRERRQRRKNTNARGSRSGGQHTGPGGSCFLLRRTGVPVCTTDAVMTLVTELLRKSNYVLRMV